MFTCCVCCHIFQRKFCTHFWPRSFVLQTLLTSSSLTFSTYYYFVQNANTVDSRLSHSAGKYISPRKSKPGIIRKKNERKYTNVTNT
jgi:hypothetical protein